MMGKISTVPLRVDRYLSFITLSLNYTHTPRLTVLLALCVGIACGRILIFHYNLKNALLIS